MWCSSTAVSQRCHAAERNEDDDTATPDGAFRSAIQVSEVGGERYLESWRMKNQRGGEASPEAWPDPLPRRLDVPGERRADVAGQHQRARRGGELQHHAATRAR